MEITLKACKRILWNKFIFKEKTYSVQNFWNDPRINDPVGNRPRDLPACGAVPQQRAPTICSSYCFSTTKMAARTRLTSISRTVTLLLMPCTTLLISLLSSCATLDLLLLSWHRKLSTSGAVVRPLLIAEYDRQAKCNSFTSTGSGAWLRAQTRGLDRLTLDHALCVVICLSSIQWRMWKVTVIALKEAVLSTELSSSAITYLSDPTSSSNGPGFVGVLLTAVIKQCGIVRNRKTYRMEIPSFNKQSVLWLLFL
jgi:hypothetical protein